MKFAFLFAILSVVAALVVTSHDSQSYAVQPKITIIPQCRWDDLCNGYASLARMGAHKYDRTFLDYLGTDQEYP